MGLTYLPKAQKTIGCNYSVVKHRVNEKICWFKARLIVKRKLSLPFSMDIKKKLTLIETTKYTKPIKVCKVKSKFDFNMGNNFFFSLNIDASFGLVVQI